MIGLSGFVIYHAGYIEEPFGAPHDPRFCAPGAKSAPTRYYPTAIFGFGQLPLNPRGDVRWKK